MNLMLASLADSTIRQYNSSYKLWWQYCNENQLDVFAPDKTHILSFLAQKFNEGCSYGSLNSHRSALSLLLGSHIISDNNIKRLLKGAYKIKPNCPKYTHTWDPQIVLTHLSKFFPHNTLSLEIITKKLVTLLAICTAHRVQTLSLINLENIVITENNIQITIHDIIKTSGPGREQPTLILPYFHENINICPATTLTDYLTITANKRPTNSNKLLITHKPPHKPATTQTISRWIKQVLSDSGVNVSIFSAHSTRHAASSAAGRAGVSIDTIRKAAGWTAASSTFARFYQREIINPNTFANAVCLPPS